MDLSRLSLKSCKLFAATTPISFGKKYQRHVNYIPGKPPFVASSFLYKNKQTFVDPFPGQALFLWATSPLNCLCHITNVLIFSYACYESHFTSFLTLLNPLLFKHIVSQVEDQDKPYSMCGWTIGLYSDIMTSVLFSVPFLTIPNIWFAFLTANEHLLIINLLLLDTAKSVYRFV